MRNALRNATAAAAFLLLVGAAVAQGDWYGHRDERYRGEHWRAQIFSNIREDLDHVQATAYSGRDEYQIGRAKEDLRELQTELGTGRYDEAKVDQVIRAIQRVTADNRLPRRDQEMLNDDVARLRQYREHHENWGK